MEMPILTTEERDEMIAALNAEKKGDGYCFEVMSLERYAALINQIALASLEADAVAWVVLNSHEGYVERNPDIVAHLEGTGLTKCKPLYPAPPVPALKLPDEKDHYSITGSSEAWKIAHNLEVAGFNECLAEVKRLNGVES